MVTHITYISQATCSIVIQFISFHLTLLVHPTQRALVTNTVSFINSEIYFISPWCNIVKTLSKGNVKWFVETNFCKLDSVLKIFQNNINICVDEKYSQLTAVIENLKKFLHANKTWFTLSQRAPVLTVSSHCL